MTPSLMDLLYEQRSVFNDVRCRELHLRGMEGRCEDEHSHPESLSTDLDQIAEEGVMKFLRLEQYYNCDWKQTLEDIKMEFPKGTATTVNLMKRIKLFQAGVTTMFHQIPILVDRVERLEKSQSKDKPRFHILRERCEDILNKEDDENTRFRRVITDDRSPGLPFGLGLPPSPAPSFARNTTVLDSHPPEPVTNQGQTGSKAGVPQTALMQNFTLKTLETLKESDVKAWVTAARQLPSDLGPPAIQTWLTTKVIRQLNTCGRTDRDFTLWSLMNKAELVLLFEEKFLNYKKDKYVKSMDDLFGSSTIKLDPQDLSVQGLAGAFDEVLEKLDRFREQIALAESEQATWKQLYQLLLKLWEQGQLKKELPWSNMTGGTAKLRAAVAVAIKARCLLPKEDPRRITTAKDLMIEIIKEVGVRNEAFQSSLEVFLEMADQYPEWKRQKTEHAPGGGAGQGTLKPGQGTLKPGQGAQLGPRVACTCGKTHAGECRTRGIPPAAYPTAPNRPSLGMQLNNNVNRNFPNKLRALKSGKNKKDKAKKYDKGTYMPKS